MLLWADKVILERELSMSMIMGSHVRTVHCTRARSLLNKVFLIKRQLFWEKWCDGVCRFRRHGVTGRLTAARCMLNI